MAKPKIWLGAAMANSGRQEEAIALYEEGLRLNPRDIYGELELSRFLYKWGYAPQAISHYRHVFQLKPNAEVAKELADALVATGKPYEAIPYYEEVQRMHPEDAGIPRIIQSIKAARTR